MQSCESFLQLRGFPPVLRAMSGGQKVSADLARAHAKANKQNMKRITEQAEGNIDLQTILLANIADFEKQQEAGRENNLSFHEMVANTKKSRQKKKKNKESGSSDEEAKCRVVPEIENEVLRRGNLCFANWYSKTIRQCLLYCDQQVDATLVVKMPHDGLQQLMEFYV